MLSDKIYTYNMQNMPLFLALHNKNVLYFVSWGQKRQFFYSWGGFRIIENKKIEKKFLI